MRLLRGNRLDLATGLSVVLATAVGIVGNVLVDAWGWPLLAALVVLVVCLVGLEIVRARAGAARQEPAGVGPAPAGQAWHTGVMVEGSGGTHIAGRDVYHVKVGGGTFLGVIAVFGVALLLSGTVVTIGRRHEAAGDAGPTGAPAASPSAASPSTASPAAIEPSPTAVPGSFSYEGVRLVSGQPEDIDPPRATADRPDVYFRYAPREGLSFVNGAAVASVPAGQLSKSGCESATGWTTRIGVTETVQGTHKCLRTSDKRYGILTTTPTVNNINGGYALITWTVWYS